LYTTNPTWTDPGSNPGLCGGRPATNRLSHGTADLYLYFTFIIHSSGWIWTKCLHINHRKTENEPICDFLVKNVVTACWKALMYNYSLLSYLIRHFIPFAQGPMLQRPWSNTKSHSTNLHVAVYTEYT
jgi:hypothetical protein